MTIYNNLAETIGNTPLVKINKLTKGKILAKVESFNPAGSIKDRPAFNMIEQAKKEGLINQNTVIIEPTSGNMGIGLALICAIQDLKLILTMPDTMSIERRKLLSTYGAELVLTDGKNGMQGAIDKAIELSEKYPNSFIPQQFANPHNPEIHEKTTAQEIYNDTNVDIFVAGVGTGGTITGCAKFLKSKNPNVKIIAVEPECSQVLNGEEAHPHKIQGIGANFVPENFDRAYVDEIFAVSDADAIETTKLLAQKEGILCGISSGAAMYAAIKFADKFPQKTVVVILPDTGERYLA